MQYAIDKDDTHHFSLQIGDGVNPRPGILFPGFVVNGTICSPSCSTCFLSEGVALQEVHGPQHVGDISTRTKLFVLFKEIPSVDGCVDTAAKVLTEALIFCTFDAQLLPTPVLDFLAKAIEVINSGEVTTPFCLRLVVHHDRSEENRRKP
jgi:hypothetical protein